MIKPSRRSLSDSRYGDAWHPRRSYRAPNERLESLLYHGKRGPSHSIASPIYSPVLKLLMRDTTTASGLAAGSKRPPDRSSPRGERIDDHSSRPRDHEVEAGDSVSTLKQPPGTAIHEAHDSSTLAAEAGPGSSGSGGAGGARGQGAPAACWRCHREIVILDGRGQDGHHLDGSSAGMAAASWDGGGGDGGSGLGQASLLSPGSDNDARDGGSEALDSSTYTPRTLLPRSHHQHHRSFPLSLGADTLLAENSAFGTLATDESRHPRSADGCTITTPNETTSFAVCSAEKRPLSRREEEEEEVTTTLELSFSQLRRHDEEQHERFNDDGGRVAAEEEESYGPRGPSAGGDDDGGCGGGGSGGGGSGPRARRPSASRRRRSRRGDRKRCKTNVLRGGSLTRGVGRRRRSRSKSRDVGADAAASAADGGGGGAVASGGAAAGRPHFFYPGDEVHAEPALYLTYIVLPISFISFFLVDVDAKSGLPVPCLHVV